MSHDLDETVTFSMANDFASGFFVPGSPPVNVKYGGATHPGKVRDNNEDHFAVIHRLRAQHFLLTNLPRENLPAFRDEAHALIVADGLGGVAAGEIASRLALEEAWELSAQASSWIMRIHDVTDQQVRERLDAYALRLNEKLQQMSRENPKLHGMGTTWTSAYVVGWNVIICQIGDSRGYLFHNDQLQQVTRDHTLAQELQDRGVEPEQTEHLRNIITNTLGGTGDDPIPDVAHLILKNGDRLLLCTDGLSDFVPDDQIADLLRGTADPQAACDALVAKALDTGGKDNVTVVIADVTEVK